MAAPLHNQIAVTATAQALTAAQTELGSFILKAHPDNAQEVFIGGSGVTTLNGYILTPGEELRVTYVNQPGIPVVDIRLHELYVVGTVNDRVSWIAVPR